ncbi:hypothetical protein ABZV75_26070 [Streptomyces flaveolus]|uniref:hypothetical protein n=1 Tax=Streptomyces flaveolus TaxID=67297 RepID=UPI0033B713FD
MSLWCVRDAPAAPVVPLPSSVGGAPGMTALIAGTLLLDVALQSGQVAHQIRILTVRPDARSLLNATYLTCVFSAEASRRGRASPCAATPVGPAMSAILLIDAVAPGRRRGAGPAGH